MKKLIKSLHLKEVGVLEMTFALAPMLSGFNLGPLPLSLLMWVLLIGFAMIKAGRFKLEDFKPLTIFVIYWFLHTLVIMAVDTVNLNGVTAQLIYFASVYFVSPALNIDKLRGSLNWVMLISIAGLLYQWGIIANGGLVHPLEIPGLSMPETRMSTLMLRPSSFYMEPAAYVAFAICPLFWALTERQWIWSVIIILSMFLTTSTTGIVLSFIMLGMTLFANKLKFRNIVLVIILGAGLYYGLTHLEMFSAGVDKIENTDTETNTRLNQGRRIVSTMNPGEYVIGAPYSTPYNYCKDRGVTNIDVDGDTVFMSTFWLLILCYGVVGLILYLYVYWRIVKFNRRTIPLVVCLMAIMFSSGYALGVSYIFTLIVLLVFPRLKDDRDRNNSYV